MLSPIFLAILLAAPPDVAALAPGEVAFGRNEYVEYQAGNLPVILSAPHGGRLRPEEIPNRPAGTFAFDVGTQELARAVSEELYRRTGGWPHVVICRLHRTKLDCNRDLPEAAAGNPWAEQAWHEYQGFLDHARDAVVRSHGRGLFIDLHGHGHKEQRLELGYLHSQAELQADDAALDGPRLASAGSLRAIAALNRLPYSQLVRGPLSFGALMEARGFPSTPSPTAPKPPLPYFRGGYNTVRHGHDGVPLAGLQIETYSKGVRDNPASRQRFAVALSETLAIYLPAQAGVELATSRTTPARSQPQPPPAKLSATQHSAAHQPTMAPCPSQPRSCFRARRGCRLFARWRCR
jgi:hypothetical protein